MPTAPALLSRFVHSSALGKPGRESVANDVKIGDYGLTDDVALYRKDLRSEEDHGV
jgi:hypothetical protein